MIILAWKTWNIRDLTCLNVTALVQISTGWPIWRTSGDDSNSSGGSFKQIFGCSIRANSGLSNSDTCWQYFVKILLPGNFSKIFVEIVEKSPFWWFFGYVDEILKSRQYCRKIHPKPSTGRSREYVAKILNENTKFSKNLRQPATNFRFYVKTLSFLRSRLGFHENSPNLDLIFVKKWCKKLKIC